MERPALGALLLHFLVLAFLAIGGAPTILPGLHRYMVETHQWLTSAQFADAYALAQVAPGPNAMYIPLIGWLVAGWAGAAVALLPCSGRPAPSRFSWGASTHAIPTPRSATPSAAV
jgi:chromate transporter